MSMFKRYDLEEIKEGFEGKHNILAEGILIPFINQTNSNRIQMFNSHIGQCVQLEKADKPMVYTGFENQVAKHNSGYYKAQGDLEILKKIVKNDLNYTLVVYDHTNRKYDVIHRHEGDHLTENYGYLYRNDAIDKFNEGDNIDKGTPVYRDRNLDENMNMSYGKNLNVIYAPYKGFTNEDGIVISESTAKNMSSWFIYKVEVSINTNDILLNLYHDEDTPYKTFPSVGQVVREDGILLGYRRLQKNEIVTKFRDSHLKMILDGDTCRYMPNGLTKVIDFDMWCNNDIENVIKDGTNMQVVEEHRNLMRYYREVVDFLKPIVEENESEFLSKDLKFFYNRVASFLDPLSEFEHDGKKFDNIVMEFKVAHLEPLRIGSKITGRYGNKGVISKILPDDEMPRLTHMDGKEIREDSKVNFRSDIVLNPFGVVNRLNPSQLVENELLYISKVVRYRMEEMDNIEAKVKLMVSFLEEVDKGHENLNMYMSVYNSLDEKGKEDFINEIISEGFYIKEEPIYRNINSFDVYDIYNKLNIDLQPNSATCHKSLVGIEYFIRLKHEAVSKLSARSVDKNGTSGVPVRTHDSKQYKDKISNTPIRLGSLYFAA